jgi:hypothetical protein
MHGISHEISSLDKGADDPPCGIIVGELPPRSELLPQKKILPEEYALQSGALQRNDQSQICSLYPSQSSNPALSLPSWQTVHPATCTINPKVPVLSTPQQKSRALNLERSLPQESSNRQLQQPTPSFKITAPIQNVNMMKSNSSQIYEKEEIENLEKIQLKQPQHQILNQTEYTDRIDDRNTSLQFYDNSRGLDEPQQGNEFTLHIDNDSNQLCRNCESEISGVITNRNSSKKNNEDHFLHSEQITSTPSHSEGKKRKSPLPSSSTSTSLSHRNYQSQGSLLNNEIAEENPLYEKR